MLFLTPRDSLIKLKLGIGCRDPNLHFVEQVALRPPEVVVDVAQQQVNEQEIAKAMAVPLPVRLTLLSSCINYVLAVFLP